MKIKFLTVLSLAVFLFLGACRGNESNSNTNANVNGTRTNMNTAGSTTTTTPAPAMDAATRTVVEEAMKKKGFNDVSVEATTDAVTLRGSVPKGKLGEAVQAAQEAAKRRVINQLSEK